MDARAVTRGLRAQSIRTAGISQKPPTHPVLLHRTSAATTHAPVQLFALGPGTLRPRRSGIGGLEKEMLQTLAPTTSRQWHGITITSALGQAAKDVRPASCSLHVRRAIAKAKPDRPWASNGLQRSDVLPVMQSATYGHTTCSTRAVSKAVPARRGAPNDVISGPWPACPYVPDMDLYISNVRSDGSIIQVRTL